MYVESHSGNPSQGSAVSHIGPGPILTITVLLIVNTDICELLHWARVNTADQNM